MKRIVSIILLSITLLSLCACSVEKTSTTKIRDIEFTVTEEKNIPEELLCMMKEKDGNPFKLTYADQGALYIAGKAHITLPRFFIIKAIDANGLFSFFHRCMPPKKYLFYLTTERYLHATK